MIVCTNVGRYCPDSRDSLTVLSYTFVCNFTSIHLVVRSELFFDVTTLTVKCNNTYAATAHVRGNLIYAYTANEHRTLGYALEPTGFEYS
jgi:hypothetical protein